MCAFQSTISNIRIKLVNFALIIEVSASSSRKMKMVNHNVNHKTIELINSLKNKGKIRILFVCLGNICRSPAGQGVMERIVDERGLNDRIFIDSAGISSYHSGDLPDQRMRVHATRRGLNLTHRSRQVCSDDFERFDLILAMDDSNYDHLRRLANSPEEMDKVKRIASFFRQYRHWDCIPDPYYGGSEGFENVLDLLDDACQNIADQIETKQI